jgi:hypothetical protein
MISDMVRADSVLNAFLYLQSCIWSSENKENQNTLSPQRKSFSEKDLYDSQPRFAHQFAQPIPNQCLDSATPSPPTDPDLARIFDVWPVLSAPIRHAILTLVESAARPE